MTRSEFIKLMAVSAGALASRTWAQPPPLTVRPPADGDAALWQPVPLLPPGPNPVTTESPVRFENSGPGLGNRIALTFDDGPASGSTEIVLKELDRRQLRASFFMIGKNAESFPALAKEVAAAGHEICNHTYDHRALSSLSAAAAADEIQRTQDILAAATGRVPRWLRPPYGAFRRKEQGHLARSRNLGVIWWTVDPLDWKKPGGRQIINRVVSATLPGSVILLHDIHRQTAQAVGPLLDQLLEKGFNFTTVSGFLGEPYGPYFG